MERQSPFSKSMNEACIKNKWLITTSCRVHQNTVLEHTAGYLQTLLTHPTLMTVRQTRHADEIDIVCKSAMLCIHTEYLQDMSHIRA